jgi:hypothetical protein
MNTDTTTHLSHGLTVPSELLDPSPGAIELARIAVARGDLRCDYGTCHHIATGIIVMFGELENGRAWVSEYRAMCTGHAELSTGAGFPFIGLAS